MNPVAAIGNGRSDRDIGTLRPEFRRSPDTHSGRSSVERRGSWSPRLRPQGVHRLKVKNLRPAETAAAVPAPPGESASIAEISFQLRSPNCFFPCLPGGTFYPRPFPGGSCRGGKSAVCIRGRKNFRLCIQFPEKFACEIFHKLQDAPI